MTRVDPVAEARRARESSEVLRALEAARAAGAGCVPLAPAEVEALEARGNTCADWSRVKVAPGFAPESVRGSHFAGDCRLGLLGGPATLPGGTELPGGIFGSTLVDTVVGDGALVKDVRLLARAVVGERAVLFDVGEATGLAGARFGCGREASLGVESGGREVSLYPEITVAVAERVALDRADALMQLAYATEVERYADALASDLCVIAAGARVLHAGSLRGVFVGPGALVDGALMIEDSCILSAEDEPAEVSTGAVVLRSVVQWGARATTGAIVDSSALLEMASVSKHAKVTGSVLGPCSVIEKGEVASSLVGPLVTQHHQSLLIAAVWPGGRGNVGAGALAGANHTGRAGDQEMRVGEGVFFGLGSRVKMPVDLSRAPYTLVTAASPLGPQRIEFPFSLVRDAGEELAREGPPRPFAHEILPAWVLAESPYTLVRSAWKQRERFTARRQPLGHEPTPDPLRPEMLALVREARDGLISAGTKDVHTSADVRGLGACVMTEAARREAVAAYTWTLVHRSLLGLWARIRRCHSLDEALGTVEGDEPDAAWTFHRAVLLEERPGALVRTLLEELVEMHGKFARAVEASKAKDDARGARVIEGYADARVAASEDPHVRRTREEAGSLAAEVSRLLEGVPGAGPGLAARKDGRP